jgi:hypothetical protein
MKQITLETGNPSVAGSLCSERLLARWGLYGVAMWLLSALTGPSVWGQAAAWLIALALAARMLVRTTEF